MIEKIIENTNEYKLNNPKSVRKNKGQFFTSIQIAKYMGKSALDKMNAINILDPGAGNGILAASVAYELITQHLCQDICIDYVESDPDVLLLLTQTKDLLLNLATEHNVNLTVNVIEDNFILSKISSEYDIVICNPPYKKIRKDSSEAKKMSDYVFGQPNLYSLFMAKGLQLLKENGKFIYITPRSWTSGNYYKKVREYIFSNMNILELVVFESRDKVFHSEEVLQETMITVGVKSQEQSEPISIKIVRNGNFDDYSELTVNSKIIKGITDDSYLIIPSSDKDVDVLMNMSRSSDTFESLGYIFKTGPVVEFRNEESLSTDNGPDKVPMFRSLNIVNGQCVFPAVTNKAQYVNMKNQKLLVNNENTLLLRRLSAKEDNKRIQCCIYKKRSEFKYISIENHVNYLAKKDGTELTMDEIEWINNLLSSPEYDSYFSMISGSTQVNASDLNKLPVKRRFLHEA